LPTTIELLEVAMKEDFETISGQVVKGTESFVSKTEKFSQKIHDEINEFIEELSS